jgi:hypothetical protein
MKHRVSRGPLTALVMGLTTSLIAPLAAAQGQPARATAARGLPDQRPPGEVASAAAVHAKPGLTCKLHAAGRKAEEGLTLVTDDDGYARFYALKVKAGDPDRKQLLACRDESGATSTYAVDLGAPETFTPHPIDLKGERGRDRPALQGDPMSRSQEELIEQGYGLRPDPAREPAGYAAWLLAASQPARMLEIKRIVDQKRGPMTISAPEWTGSVLTGAWSYVAVQSFMNVPTAIPGGDGTVNTAVMLWNGLGGFGTGSGLIQSGAALFTTRVTAAYATWREYCCNDPNGVTFPGAFVPDPQDLLFVQNWYCDGQGKVDLNGGFGCSFVQDLTSGALLNCTSTITTCPAAQANPLCSTSPVPNCMRLGFSAELIIEHASDQLQPPFVAFTDFKPSVIMNGFATSTGGIGANGNIPEDIATSPAVFLLTDFTNSSTQIDVTLGPPYLTCFTIYPRNERSLHVQPCANQPLPPMNTPIDIARREELVAAILFGVIQDGGGVAIVDGTIIRLPPRGPLPETLAALPTDLSGRIAPLLKELPSTANGINALAAQLTKVVVDYRNANLARSRQP